VQLKEYYPDLSDPAMESAIALIHSRFSTNTFPTWDLRSPSGIFRTTGKSIPSRGTGFG
jgi:glutamate synthase domain-containing protein 1